MNLRYSIVFEETFSNNPVTVFLQMSIKKSSHSNPENYCNLLIMAYILTPFTTMGKYIESLVALTTRFFSQIIFFDTKVFFHFFDAFSCRSLYPSKFFFHFRSFWPWRRRTIPMYFLPSFCPADICL